jgi:hypothetical protein
MPEKSLRLSRASARIVLGASTTSNFSASSDRRSASAAPINRIFGRADKRGILPVLAMNSRQNYTDRQIPEQSHPLPLPWHRQTTWSKINQPRLRPILTPVRNVPFWLAVDSRAEGQPRRRFLRASPLGRAQARRR